MEVTMKFVVLFEDNLATGADVRRTYMPEHLAFLELNAAKIQAAGPLQESDGQAAGGVWLVNANDLSEVDALVREDPFWPTGLRRSVRILWWNQVFADGRRLIAV
jgi:uncharacterized protein YciI